MKQRRQSEQWQEYREVTLDQAKKKEKWRRIAGWASTLVLFFLLYLLRIHYTGMDYQPILHDFAYFGSGIYQTDPLNSGILSDIVNSFLWSGMWNNLSHVYLLMAALYFASIMMLYYVFSRHFRVTMVFPILCLLSPLVVPGTYYVGAAVSIVPAFFLACVAAVGLQMFADLKSITGIMLFFFAQLVSLCFCKQTAVFSLVLGFMVIWLARREMNVGVLLLNLINTGVAAAIYFLVGLFEEQSLWDVSGLQADAIWAAIQELFFTAGGQLLSHGMNAGMDLLWKTGTFHLIVLLVLACVVSVLGFFLHDCVEHPLLGDSLGEILWSLILWVAPLLPAFLIRDAQLQLYALVPMTVGFALVCNYVYKLLFRWMFFTRLVGSGVCVVLIFTMSVGAMYEQRCLQEAGQKDGALLTSIQQNISLTNRGDRVLLIGGDPMFSGVFTYGEHIRRITYDDTSINDAVIAARGNMSVGTVHLLSKEQFEQSGSMTAEEMLTYQVVLRVKTGKVEPLQVRETDTACELLDADGNVVWSAEKTIVPEQTEQLPMEEGAEIQEEAPEAMV